MVIYCAIKCIVSRCNVFLSGFLTNNQSYPHLLPGVKNWWYIVNDDFRAIHGPDVGGEQVSCDWWRAGHVTLILVPDWSGLWSTRPRRTGARTAASWARPISCRRCGCPTSRWALIGWELRSVLSCDWLRCCRSTCASSSASGRSWRTWPGSSSSRTGRFCTQCPQRWGTIALK